MKLEVRSQKLEVKSQHKNGFLLALLCSVALCLCVQLHAQTPTLTTVQDTVYRSDGTVASGTVVITWRPFVTADSKPVFGGTKTVLLGNGALAVALVPNEGGTPSGTSYNVKYYQSGNVFFEETWVVPSSSPLPSPGSPTVTNIGAQGSTTYYYWVSAKNAEGETLLGSSGATTTSNATLDGTNYNEISWSTIAGATSYRVWRTTTSTAPSETGNYLVGETAGTSINDQSNNLTSGTVPGVNDTDPRTLADVRVTATPSPTVTLAASQVSGTAIVSNPDKTQNINAPPKAGVIPLQIKGQPQANANILEIYDSQASPVLQSYFNLQGGLVTQKPITASDSVTGGTSLGSLSPLIGQAYANASFNWFAAKDQTTRSIALLGFGQQSNTSANAVGIYGVSDSTNSSGNIGSSAAVEGDAYHSGAGTAGYIIGVVGYAETIASSGNVTNAISLYAKSNQSSGGAITNNYGLKIEDQTVAANNWALRTGLGKVQFGDDVMAPTVNNIRYADQFAGADAGAKIAACIVDLPSTGGICDARGLEGAQIFSSNPFDGVTKPVRVLLGAASFTTSVNIVIPDSVQVIGLAAYGGAQGYTTRIRAAVGFSSDYTNADINTRRAIVVLGESSDSIAQGAWIENVHIECQDIPNSIGIYSESAQEASGGQNLVILNCPWRGIWLEATATRTPQNLTFREISIGMSDLPDLQAGAVGMLLQGSGDQIRVDRASIGVRGTGGGGSLTAGMQIERFAGELNNIHIENSTDGILLGSSNNSAKLVFSGITGCCPSGATVTNLIHISSSNSVQDTTLQGLWRNGSTNLILDDVSTRTITQDAMALYITSGSSVYLNANTLYWDGGNSRLGIGKNNPVDKLDIAGGSVVLDNNQAYRARDTSGTARGILSIGADNSTRLSSFAGQSLIFLPAATEAARFDSTGKVGIGTGATVSAKLDVNGAIRSTLTTVTFSATPTFDASLGNSFKIMLTDNVASSTLSNAVVGQHISFLICQDAMGNRTFVWPANVKGGMTIGSTLSTCSAQTFLYDGTNAYALASGVTGM